MFLAIGSVIIDDIIRPDGQTHMGALGGAATHAAMGMRVWSERVGVVTAIGRDFPEAAHLELARAFDLRACGPVAVPASSGSRGTSLVGQKTGGCSPNSHPSWTWSPLI